MNNLNSFSTVIIIFACFFTSMIAAQPGELAESNSDSVKRWQRIAEARRLVIQSKLLSDDYPSQAVRLAIEAANSTCQLGEPMTSEARQQLYQLISQIGGSPIRNESPTCSPLILRNGTLIYVTNRDSGGKIVIEDGASGIQSQLSIRHNGTDISVNDLSISPNEQWLVAVGHGALIAWNLNSKDIQASRILLADRPMMSMKFSREGDSFMALFRDNSAHRWNVDSNGFQLIADVDLGVNREQALFSANGQWLMTYSRHTGTDAKVIDVWDITSPNDRKTEIPVNGQRIDSALISDDGKWIAVEGFDYCQLFEFDSTHSKWHAHDLFHLERGQAAQTNVEVVAFSPDSKYLVTSALGKGEIWKLDELPKRWATIPDFVMFAEFTGDNSRLVTWSAAGSGFWKNSHGFTRSPGVLRVWDYKDLVMTTDDQPEPRVRGTILSVERFRISPDSKVIVVVASPAKHEICLVWDIEPDGANPTPREFEIEHPTGAKLSRDGNWFAYSQGSKFICLLSLDNATQNAQVKKIPIRKGGIHNIQFSTDNRWLTTDGPVALLFDLHAPDIVTSCIELPTDARETDTCRIACSEDARWITVLTSSGKICFWNLMDNELIQAAAELLGESK